MGVGGAWAWARARCADGEDIAPGHMISGAVGGGDGPHTCPGMDLAGGSRSSVLLGDVLIRRPEGHGGATSGSPSSCQSRR